MNIRSYAKIALVALAASMWASVPARAQIADCHDCILGLYDDAARTSTMGTSTAGTIKSIYMGIDYAGAETGLTGLEFSIHGMRTDVDGILIIGQNWIVPPAVSIGASITSPADTSATSTGTGGLSVAWSACQTGSRTLLQLDFVHFAPLVNKVFTVMHKFPPSNPLYNRRPIFTRCDSPNFTGVRISGGCYILNWNGNPNAPCTDKPVAVEPRAWSSVKALFR